MLSASRHRDAGGRKAPRTDLSRVEAFSDAVLAIAITVLVVELQLPANLGEDEMLEALAARGPQLFSFVLSFWVIGRFWMSHHRIFRHLNGYDDSLLVLNLAFLGSVAFLPFPTAVLGEYMHHRWALMVYAGSVALAGTLFSLLWAHVAYRARLVTDIDNRKRRLLTLRFVSIPVVFTLSMPVILVDLRHTAAAMWVLLPPAVRGLLSWWQRRRRHPRRPPRGVTRPAGGR